MKFIVEPSHPQGRSLPRACDEKVNIATSKLLRSP